MRSHLLTDLLKPLNPRDGRRENKRRRITTNQMMKNLQHHLPQSPGLMATNVLPPISQNRQRPNKKVRHNTVSTFLEVLTLGWF